MPEALLGGQSGGLVFNLHPYGQLWGEVFGAGTPALGPEVLNHMVPMLLRAQ